MTWKDRKCCYCNVTAHQPFSSQQRCILLSITKHRTSSSLNYRPYSMERSVQKQCFNYSTKQCTRHNIPVGQPTNHSEPCIISCTMPGWHYASSQLTHNGTLQCKVCIYARYVYMQGMYICKVCIYVWIMLSYNAIRNLSKCASGSPFASWCLKSFAQFVGRTYVLTIGAGHPSCRGILYTTPLRWCNGTTGRTL